MSGQGIQCLMIAAHLMPQCHLNNINKNSYNNLNNNSKNK